MPFIVAAFFVGMLDLQPRPLYVTLPPESCHPYGPFVLIIIPGTVKCCQINILRMSREDMPDALW